MGKSPDHKYFIMENRNFALVLILCTFFASNLFGQSNTKNKQKKSDWVTLFDGTSTNEWRSTHSDEFPKQGWKVEGNVLTVLAKTESTPAGTDIITKKLYSSFELELEINLTEGANSGIKYFVSDAFPGYEGQYLGLEFQLIDDERHPDAKLGRDGNRTMASLYDLIPPVKDKKVNPPGKWNKIKLVVDGNHVEHWVNGKKVLEFDRKSDSFRQLVKISKYKDFKNFGEIPEGHILLQGHSDQVSFRNIKIKTL